MTRTRARLVAAAAMTTIGAGVIALPAIGFGAGGTTLTATATSTTATTGTTSTASGTTAAARRVDHTARRAEYEKALAAELGVDVTKLRAAQQAAQEKVFVANLDEMVAAGRLTAAEETALRAAAANGTLTQALKDMRLAKLKARLDAAVADDRLTQAEANRILADARTRSADDVGLGFGRGGFGEGRGGEGPGGHHGGRGGFRP